MITNETGNNFIWKVSYRAGSVNHKLTLYPKNALNFVMATGEFISPVTPLYSTSSYTNVGSYFMDLMRSTQVLTEYHVLNNIEVWMSAEGANEFVGTYTPADTTVLDSSNRAPRWASYVNWSFKTSTRKVFRLTLYDGAYNNPTKQAVTPTSGTPAIDQGHFLAEVLARFNNNDGDSLVATGNRTTGNNRALVKRYGNTANGYNAG